MHENLLKFIVPILLMLCKKKKILLTNKLSDKEKLTDFIKEKLYLMLKMYIGICYGKIQRKYLTTSGMPAGGCSLKMLVGNKPATEKSVAKHINRVYRFQCHSGV